MEARQVKRVAITAILLLQISLSLDAAPLYPWLQTLPHRHKIIFGGTHDWCFVREPQATIEILGEGTVCLQDCEALIEGVRFLGSPWQPEFNDWAFNLACGEALASMWELILTGIHVLMTHDPPCGIEE